jgi:DNA polymerase I-like protein with 3'-5' exonuclease and polymerase domains
MSDWCPLTELPDLRRAGLIALDLETRDGGIAAERGSAWPWGDGHICGVSTAYRADGIRGHYFPLRHPDSQNFDPEQIYRWVRDHVAADVRFVTQNGLYDWGWLRTEAGIHMPPGERLEEIGALATMIDENRFKYSLDALCAWRGLPGKDETLLHQGIEALGLVTNKCEEIVPQEYLWRLPARYVGPYAERDTTATLDLFEKLNPILDQENTRAAYRREVDLLPMVAEMRRRGIRIDQAAAEQARERILAKRNVALADLSEKLGTSAGMTEIRSSKWLTRTFDAEEISYPQTEKGNPSFKAGRDGWMVQHPHWLPQLVAGSRRYQTAVTFLESLIEHTVRGRIHAEIHPHRSDDGGTRTTRFSYSKPALQQTPKHNEELAPLIRGIFLPEEGEVWATGDASQQEFRLLVHFAAQHDLPRAREVVERYLTDPTTDAHTMVAEMTGLGRAQAKNVNYGKIYGTGVKRFAEMIRKPVREARAIYNQYDRELPFVSRLATLYESIAKRQAFIELYDGARRHFDWECTGVYKKGAGPCSREEAERRVTDPEHRWYGRRRQLRCAETHKALNSLVQGSAARLTKIWMLACWREGVVPLLQMHDALECSVSSPEQAEMVARLGSEAAKLLVPMRIDLAFGRNWGDAKHTWDELHSDGMPPSEPTTAPGRDDDPIVELIGEPGNEHGEACDGDAREGDDRHGDAREGDAQAFDDDVGGLFTGPAPADLGAAAFRGADCDEPGGDPASGAEEPAGAADPAEPSQAEAPGADAPGPCAEAAASDGAGPDVPPNEGHDYSHDGAGAAGASAEEIAAIRLALVEHGYLPIPMNGKKPSVKDWPSIVADASAINSWKVERSGERNTGSLTKCMPAIDVDILDSAAAQIIETLVCERFAGKGKLLRRIGQAPKRAFVFRADQPFPKLLLGLWAPGESQPQNLSECRHKIEILGAGQLLVVHGTHPDTQRPYEWTGGEPWTVARDELPALSRADAEAFLTDAKAALAAAGWGVFEAPAQQTQGDDPLIVELATKVWGAPTFHQSDQYRFGGKGSKSVDARARSWFDFESNTGGGINDLMKLVKQRGGTAKNSTDGVVSRLMQTSAEFVAGFVPPDYLIDGLLQRRYVYSLTGPTGSGKTAIALRIGLHVATGRALTGRSVEKGRVLFFAGENPDDVRSRWIKLCEELDEDPDMIEVVFMPFTPNLSEVEVRKRIDAEATEHGPFNLLIVDTSASYYSGDDENDNVALGNHARMLRSFIGLPGGPTILVTCHPTKTPNMDNLLPRGGGAFLAEVDGNLVCIMERATMVVEVTTHGKFRGPDFAPFSFKLIAGKSQKLVDTKGREIWSVFAQPVSNAEIEVIEQQGCSDQDTLLRAMLERPGDSLIDFANRLSWVTIEGLPNKTKVHRILKDLKQSKFVEQTRNKRYALTTKGRTEAEKTAMR